MMKVLFFAFTLLATLAGCNNATVNQDEQTDQTKEIQTVSVSDFLKDPSEFSGKTIQIEGTVSHVCKHGGKKMFMAAEGIKETVRIDAGGTISAFDVIMEGQDLIVEAEVKEFVIDENFIAQMEEEVQKNHEGEEVHEEGQSGGTIQQLENYKTQLAESGKERLVTYTVEGKKIITE